MLILWGSKTYGRDNGHTRYGWCDHCGSYAQLKSYDTAQFFMLWYIPIIPLGRKRIINECPSCKMARQMSLRKYKKLQETQLAEAVTNMKSDPDDAEKAIAAIQTFVSFSDFEHFEQMAPLLAQKHASNAEIQATIAAAYDHIGKTEEAESYYRKAVSLGDDPENREDLALNLVFQGKLDEAETLLEHIITTKDKDKSGKLYFLVEAYRDQGLHDKALALLADIENIDPAIAEDDAHNELKTTTLTGKEVAEPINSPLLHAPRGVEKLPGGVPLWVPGLVPLGIIAAVLNFYVLSSVKLGSAREVWLVNGTEVAYTASVGGESYTMRPHGVRVINMAEGTIPITITGSALPMEEATVEYKTRFFTRTFSRPTIVINPDGLALIIEEETIYSSTPDPNYVNPYKIHTGKSFYAFKGIDFPFKEFPDEIQLSSSSSSSKRTRLQNFVPDDIGVLLSGLQQALPPEELSDYFMRRAHMVPEDSMTLYALSAFMAQDHEGLVEFMRPGLDVRPLLVDWHRIYQSTMEIHDPEQDIRADYEKLLRESPDSQELKYLLGRVTPDPREAEKLFLASEKGDAPIGLGYGALAYQRLCAGDFQGAFDNCKQAFKIVPDRIELKSVQDSALLALKRYNALLKRVRTSRQDSPYDAELAGLEVWYLALMGKTASAKKVIDDYFKEVAVQFTDEERLQVQHAFNAILDYVSGDYTAYAQAIAKSYVVDGPFYAAIQSGDAESAVAAMKELEYVEFTHYLLAYCVAAVNQGKETVADEMLQEAVALLEGGDHAERRAARMLKGDVDTARAELANLQMVPEQKRILATSLALALPDARGPCVEVARLHNFNPSFPQAMLKECIHTAGN